MVCIGNKYWYAMPLATVGQNKLTGLQSAGQVGSCVFGYTVLNHIMASSDWSPPSHLFTLTRSRGVCDGSNAHLLWPDTKAFHALVPSGSIWMPVPDRLGPITNHLEEPKRSSTIGIK